MTPRTLAHQDPLSMGFPRQEYWRGLPFPSSGDLPNPGIEAAIYVAKWANSIFVFVFFPSFFSLYQSRTLPCCLCLSMSSLYYFCALIFISTWKPLILYFQQSHLTLISRTDYISCGTKYGSLFKLLRNSGEWQPKVNQMQETYAVSLIDMMKLML